MRTLPAFALIVTVSILVLLATIAVGLLTVSSIAVRSGGLSSARSEARANARVALILAIGELQKQVGPDQRVSANAAILDGSPETAGIDGVANPHWTGVWDSWAAGREAYGSDTPSDHRTIRNNSSRLNTRPGMSPSYEEGREDHFRSWLVSLSPEERENIDSARNLSIDGVAFPEGDSSGVRLVGEGSVGENDSDKFVSASLVDVRAKRNGRFAWWVADESSKARILQDAWEDREKDLSISELLSKTQSAGAPGFQILDPLVSADDPELLARVSTRNSLELAADEQVAGRETRTLFHDVTPWSLGVLADVREGGLKQDLSTLLERPISTRRPMHRLSTEDPLYSFDRQGQEQVPIQDLAAYYQCYREVVDYSGRSARNPSGQNALQVNNIDFGKKSRDLDLGTRFNFTRDYTNLYRMPIPVKIQFMLSYIVEPRTLAEKRQQPENKDDYKLFIGMTPSFTMWNPFNVPIVMNHGTSQSTQLRLFNIPFGMSWNKNGQEITDPNDQNDLVWITNRNTEGWRRNNAGGWSFNEQNDRDNGLTLYVGGKRPVVFQPGEVRIFSLREGQLRGNDELLNSNVWRDQLETHPGWDPNSYLVLPRSEKSSAKRHVQIEHPGATPGRDGRKAGGGALTFKAGDSVTLSLDPAGSRDMANGAALHFFIRQSETMTGGQEQGNDRAHMRRQYQLTSRLHTWNQTEGRRNNFNDDLMRKMFPGNSEKLSLNVPVNTLLRGRRQAFLLVSLTAACEVSEGVAGVFQGRRFPSRPFLHSSPVQSVAFIDRIDSDADYHHGWNWWVEPINSEDEVGGVAPNNWNSYYGGSYNADFGNSFCVQQEIPLTPVHSIAALSHAQLSGYSLADRILGRSAGARNEASVTGYRDNPFANVTATGGNGLFPRMTQAIGNSYAHPHLAPDEAYSTWTRHYNVTNGPKTIPFVDHSYLANKALWDEYFFSSIAPHGAQHAANRSKIWDDDEQLSARQLAEKFFFDGGELPNPRFIPYLSGLDEDGLDEFFERENSDHDGAEGFSAHMLVKGPFNINSTSVDAWKALFASQRKSKVQVMEVPSNPANGRLARWPRSINTVELEDEKTAVSGFSVINGEPWEGSTSDPSDPEQWTSWRALTDEQIEELAEAMVKQVKLRGPFLSLSEFVNRRLDGSNKELSLKGALQAALDDEDVSINEGFRDADRSFKEVPAGMTQVKFPEAMLGPIAYGSSAYVDQADILRNFGAQLTPRGDSFVVRAYGDSMDGTGRVIARAWCEAVVQRVPEYLESGTGDEAQTAQEELDSDVNRVFGRPLRVVSFRWLDHREI